MAKLHPNSAKTRIKKGEVRNPKGRPPKLVSHFLKEFEDAGYKGVKPSQVQGIMELMLNLDRSDLIDLWDKKEVPVIISTIAKELSRSDKAWQVINDMLDRAHGKPKSKSEIEVTGKVENDYTKLSTEELLQLKAKLDGDK